MVPSERATLGKAKRKGQLKQYLDEIDSDQSRGVERWFYTNWLQAKWFKAAQKKRRESSAPAASDTALQEGPALQEVATEELPGGDDEYKDTQPAFFSLDNPTVFTALLLSVIIGLAALSR